MTAYESRYMKGVEAPTDLLPVCSVYFKPQIAFLNPPSGQVHCADTTFVYICDLVTHCMDKHTGTPDLHQQGL